MSSATRLEDDVRQTLRARAEALVVEDRGFDPGRVSVVELPNPGRQQRRSRGLLIAAVVMVLVVSAAVIAHQTSRSGTVVAVRGTVTTLAPTSTTGIGSTSGPRQLAPASLVDQVTSVPADVLATVGRGTVTLLPKALPGPALANRGKPRIVWIGAEYCPYCAAQRWALVNALSRFGTFSGLNLTTSAAVTSQGSPEVFPKTPSFSFYGAKLQSDYIQFESVEELTNSFKPLETPTAEQSQLLTKYDAPPYSDTAGSIPFIDFANEYLTVGATYDVGALNNKTYAQIATAMHDPSTDIAKGVIGAANVITATICELTNNQPASACATAVIMSIEHALGHQS
jgi:hypothetical protein